MRGRLPGVALATLAVAGCATSSATTAPSPNGVASRSAQQIIDTARTNAKAQSTVHIKGTGTCEQVGPFGVDMKLRHDGNGTGTITTTVGKVSVVSTPGTLYLQGPKAFWAAQTSAEAVAQIGSSWVRLPDASSACFAALASFDDVLSNYLDVPGAPAKDKGTSIFGIPAALVVLPPDVSVWIASTGTPLPIYVSAPSIQLKLAMGQWGAPVEVTVPSGVDVLDSSAIVAN